MLTPVPPGPRRLCTAKSECTATLCGSPGLSAHKEALLSFKFDTKDEERPLPPPHVGAEPTGGVTVPHAVEEEDDVDAKMISGISPMLAPGLDPSR